MEKEWKKKGCLLTGSRDDKRRERIDGCTLQRDCVGKESLDVAPAEYLTKNLVPFSSLRQGEVSSGNFLDVYLLVSYLVLIK